MGNGQSNDNVNPDDDNAEPDFVEQEISEQIEIEEDVIKEVLIDDEYKNSELFLSEKDRKKYKAYFKQADTNKDGVVDGGEANKYFSKSKLNRKTLAKLWTLSDQKKKAK